MLNEFKHVRQEPGPGRRRWFESDGLEVVVWLDARDGVTGFQLCYDLGEGDRALTWRAGEGFSHSTIDSGEQTPLANLTPILEPDGEVPWGGLLRLFDERSATLEAGLRETIRDKLVGAVDPTAR